MKSKNIDVNASRSAVHIEDLPLVLTGMQQFFPEGDSITRPSEHEYHELTYVRSGKIDYIIKGKKYHLVPGSTIVVKPHVPHSYVVIEECDIACIYFAYQSKDTAGENSISLDPYASFLKFTDSIELEDENGEEQFQYAMMLKGKGRREIAAIAEAIMTENTSDEYGKVFLLQALALQLIIQFTRALKAEWEEAQKVKNGKAKELVYIAQEYIDNNYDQNISMTDVANHVFLSPGYFARAFREEIGVSPMTYLMRVRVAKAAELLEKTDIKVSSIARLVGFTSPQRFNSAFKKHKETTPMAFRKTMQEAAGIFTEDIEEEM